MQFNHAGAVESQMSWHYCRTQRPVITLMSIVGALVTTIKLISHL